MTGLVFWFSTRRSLADVPDLKISALQWLSFSLGQCWMNPVTLVPHLVYNCSHCHLWVTSSPWQRQPRTMGIFVFIPVQHNDLSQTNIKVWSWVSVIQRERWPTSHCFIFGTSFNLHLIKNSVSKTQVRMWSCSWSNWWHIWHICFQSSGPETDIKVSRIQLSISEEWLVQRLSSILQYWIWTLTHKVRECCCCSLN